ncbi:MAG: hypothetical protein DWQ37_02820 [Planctomycetota bacterium]|nr:MAG: hypothetical protein DWQ37_02820 [Planctomycetota bacterium]
MLFRIHWPWRALIFLALVVVILDLEQALESWWLPTTAAALAVRQLQPSTGAAESLRVFEWARHILPVVSGGLIAAAGLVAFVPLPRRWVQWFERTFA